MEVDQIPTKTEWFERIYYVHKLKLCCPFFLPQTDAYFWKYSLITKNDTRENGHILGTYIERF